MSSQALGRHYVAPLMVDGARADVIGLLKRILTAMPRVRIVAEDANYLRAECSSRVFGYVDDVELFFDAAASVVHVRAAARRGYSDFGVNRRRVEAIRSAIAAR